MSDAALPLALISPHGGLTPLAVGHLLSPHLLAWLSLADSMKGNHSIWSEATIVGNRPDPESRQSLQLLALVEDAKFYAERASDLAQGSTADDVVEMYRYVRAAIVFSTIGVEAFLNVVLKPVAGRQPPRSLRKRVEYFLSEQLQVDKETYEQLMRQLSQMYEIRNRLVHYEGERYPTHDEVFLLHGDLTWQTAVTAYKALSNLIEVSWPASIDDDPVMRKVLRSRYDSPEDESGTGST